MNFYLSFDTETSGLPVAGIPKGHDQYPWPVQIGMELFDDDAATLGIFESQVRSDGRKMSAGAIAVHGITDRSASRDGISEIAMLAVASGFAAQADYAIGFSVTFDIGVLESALMRLGKSTRMLVRPGLQIVDLKEPAAQACKIQSDHDSGTYRWPTLDKACEIILGEPPRTGKHRGLADAQRAKRLFFALRERGLIDIQS